MINKRKIAKTKNTYTYLYLWCNERHKLNEAKVRIAA